MTQTDKTETSDAANSETDGCCCGCVGCIAVLIGLVVLGIVSYHFIAKYW